MIYVLLLEQGKIYVGYSERPISERVLEHFRRHGSRWTTMYRPLQLLSVINGGGLKEENETTLKMMDKYGWWNVRGGSWCKVEMDSCPPALMEYQRLKMPPELNQQKAPKPHSSTSSRATSKTSSLGLKMPSAFSRKSSRFNGCTRCGRDSHPAVKCYAKTDIAGLPLDHERTEFDSESDLEDPKEAISDSNESADICFRCGRDSHWAKDCYAKTDVNGYRL
ncbi:Cullin-4A [Chytridiales sp. JEL 0842]|nr:Cullin-4A [Chytridiales sp. JEL 0842]